MATALRTSGSSSAVSVDPAFVRIAAISASTPWSRFARVEQSLQIVQRVVERLARQEATVEHHFAILRDDVVANPACDTRHGQTGVADQRMVKPPQFAIARIEQGHELARREDRVHAKLRAAGMRGLPLGADKRPQAPFVRGKDGVVGWLADYDQVGRWLLASREPVSRRR